MEKPNGVCQTFTFQKVLCARFCCCKLVDGNDVYLSALAGFEALRLAGLTYLVIGPVSWLLEL